jgi:hypothetical protein
VLMLPALRLFHSEQGRDGHDNRDQPQTPGEHTVASRAIDTAGKIQPAMDDPIIANKKTYWESNGQITRHVHIT